MNGFDPYSGAGEFGDSAGPSIYSSGGIIPESSSGLPPSSPGVLDQLKGVFDRFTSRPTSTESGVAGQLYNAIYAFGAGKLDAARESAARALLASRTGSRFVGAVEQERMKQLAPMFILGAVVIFGIAFALGRR